MRALLYKVIAVLLIGIMISCSSGGDGDTNTQNTSNPSGNSDNPTTTPPGSFSLIFPNNNEICQEGAAVADQSEKLLINFKWDTSANAISYILVVVESESGNEIANIESSATNQNVEVSKGKLYQWYVVASNTDGEVSSTQWSFHSRGEIIGNYVPYPPYNIKLLFDTINDLLSIEWEASDEDEDALSFDIIVFQNGIEVFSVKDIANNTISDIPVTVGSTYHTTITVKDGISAVTSYSEEITYE